MITVPDGTKTIIERSRYLSEALSKKIINHSALALYIKPELEEMLYKKVTKASIVMAIRRLEDSLSPAGAKSSLFKKAPEMLLRSGLSLVTIKRTRESEDTINELFLERTKGTFHAITIGSSEIIVAVSSEFVPQLLKKLDNKFFISIIPKVSLITIYLPKEMANLPGVYYFFLKSLAWENINIMQCTSTSSEYTLFFNEDDVQKAFAILSSLFNRSILENNLGNKNTGHL